MDYKLNQIKSKEAAETWLAKQSAILCITIAVVITNVLVWAIF